MKITSFKTTLFIALRYLFSKKKHNVINIISLISTLGIMVSTAALIVVLSVFNGMEVLIGNSFNSFNPDLRITPAQGKSFAVDTVLLTKLKQINGIRYVEEVVCDMTLITYHDRQILANLKGVSPDYPRLYQFDSIVFDGSFDLKRLNNNYAVLGIISAGNLQINLNEFVPLKFYYPKRNKKNLSNPTDAFRTDILLPSGVFATNTIYDEQFIFCPIQFARQLMDYENEVTSIEILFDKNAKPLLLQKQVENMVGENFIVKNKYQQEELLFKTMKSEKLIVFIILVFILVLAAFNIIGCLGMLIVEKKQDIGVLKCLGASQKMIRQIFVFEGVVISSLGGLLGILLGFILCFLQQSFHLIKLGGDGSGYIIQYYPVEMQFKDFLLVFLTVLIISFITAWFPSKNIKKISR